MLQTQLKLVKKQIAELKGQFTQKEQHLNELKQTSNAIAQLEEQIDGVKQNLGQLLGTNVGSSQDSCVDFTDVDISQCAALKNLIEKESQLKEQRNETELSIDSFKQNQVANEVQKTKLETELKKLQGVEKLSERFESTAKEAHALLKKLNIPATVKQTWNSQDF